MSYARGGWGLLRSTHPTNCIAAMAAPTGSGRAGASRFQLSHQNGATHRKNASIWSETTGGRHRLLNEINRLQQRQPWQAACNTAADLPAGQLAMRTEEQTTELLSLIRTA